jgi:hypothetical protein
VVGVGVGNIGVSECGLGWRLGPSNDSRVKDENENENESESED